jgi:sugar phosphate isomerase/epimerase
MLNRRRFLQTITAGTAAVILPGTLGACNTTQARSLENIGFISGIIGRELREGDWKEVLSKTADMGYTEIETGNYLGESARSFLDFCQEIGIRPVAGGGSFSNDMDEVNRALDRLKSLELQYAVMYWPWFTGAPLSLDNCKESAELLNKIGEVCHERDLILCWHNHDLEFHATAEGVIPFDYLMENTDSNLVKCELDIYWTKKGGADPVETLQKYSGRYPLLHIKDMAPGAEQDFACPGNGIIDFQKVLNEALEQDIRHFFVEKDNAQDGMGCLESAATYLKSLSF